MKEPPLRSSPPGGSQELSVKLRSLIRLRAATVLGIHATARPSVVRRRARPAWGEIPGEFWESGGEKGDQKSATAKGAGSSRADECHSNRGYCSEKDVALPSQIGEADAEGHERSVPGRSLCPTAPRPHASGPPCRRDLPARPRTGAATSAHLAGGSTWALRSHEGTEKRSGRGRQELIARRGWFPFRAGRSLPGR